MEKYVFLIYILEFLLLFLIIYLYYRLIGLKKITLFKKKEENIKEKKDKKDKKKKKTKKDNFNKDIAEIKLFVLLNRIDGEKIDYKKLAKQLVFIISFDIALTTLLAVELFDNILLKILVGFVILIASVFLGYKLLGFIYKKKGLTKECTTSKK